MSDFRGKFASFRGPGGLLTGAAVVSMKSRPARFVLYRNEFDPAGVFRVKHGNAHLCSFRASTEAEALELLPELAEALTRKSVERYPGEQNDARLVQGALEALFSRQATVTSYADGRTEIEPNRIKQVVRAIGDERFAQTANAALIVFGPDGRKYFNEARARRKRGDGTFLDREVERLYREKISFESRDGDPSYRWQVVFLSRFVSLKSRYIENKINATFWPWVACELLGAFKIFKIRETPKLETLQNFASKHNLQAPR